MVYTPKTFTFIDNMMYIGSSWGYINGFKYSSATVYQFDLSCDTQCRKYVFQETHSRVSYVDILENHLVVFYDPNYQRENDFSNYKIKIFDLKTTTLVKSLEDVLEQTGEMTAEAKKELLETCFSNAEVAFTYKAFLEAKAFSYFSPDMDLNA